MTESIRQPKGFYRSVFMLMIPMVLQNIITQTVALADTFMVGMLGEQFLAATTMATTPFFIFMIFTFGVQSGAGILVAQYWGKGNTNAINRVLGIGLYFSVSVTLIGAILIFLFPYQILNLVTNDKALIEIGVGYARIASFSQVFSAASMIYLACQRSMENARLGVIILSISSVINIIGNWILIFGKLGMPALGIEGAAIATLFARIVELIIVAVYAFREKRLGLKLMLLIKPGMVILRDFIKYSLPVLLNEALWGFGAMLYPVILGHMEGAATILAAYTIAGNLERLFAVTVFACGNATAVIIGREIGAGRKDGVYGVGKALIRLGFILGLISGGLLMLARFTILEPFVYPLFDLTPGAASAATIMLTILAVAIPLRTLGFTMGIGILRGGGDVKVLMFIDVGTLYLIAIPFAAVTGLVLKTGIAVVYASLLLEDVAKTALCAWRVRQKKWINDVTREGIE